MRSVSEIDSSSSTLGTSDSEFAEIIPDSIVRSGKSSERKVAELESSPASDSPDPLFELAKYFSGSTDPGSEPLGLDGARSCLMKTDFESPDCDDLSSDVSR